MKKDFVVRRDATLQEFEEMQKLYNDLPEEGPSLLQVLQQSDVINGMSDLLKSGWYVDIATKKITCKPSIEHDAPWIYVNPNPTMYCGLYRHVFISANFVHSYCMGCYKVVVKPRTIKELFLLYDLQLNEAKPQGWYCKCGIEQRPYVSVQYGGYFYCTGLEQGKKRWRQVRELVDKMISSEVPVTLKKYCTEFEIKLGPTKTYKRPMHAGLVEKRIEGALDLNILKNVITPQYLKDHVMWKWLNFAWERGDMTCLEYNNGKPFYTPSETYHDELETEYYESKMNLVKESENG